ncbi:MAG: TIR domain-containing protein [Steroidobacteraceae bacterium]
MAGGIGQETVSVKAPTVFISYASQDAALANAVVVAVEQSGITCWIAPRDVEPGALYADEIIRAINDCIVVVVVLSAQSIASHHVGKELERASSKRRRIIALRTDTTALPRAFEYFLSESQWIDVGTGGIEPAAAKLAEAIHRHHGSSLESSIDGSRTGAVARKITSTTESPTERLPSIAVLSFANMSGDKEQEYFSDGLAEEIINALTQIAGLKVIARTSAFAFKGQNTDIRRIAETLGVTHVLEGSVRRSGNRIRVTAQLITATDGTHLWSERYDRELADVFAVQDEISAAISNALKLRFSPQAAAKPRHTPTLPAYEALLKARHFHWKQTAESMEQAKLFYEQAIALDPQYALAHSDYAEYLFGRAVMGLSPMRKVAPLIRNAAQRALALDPSLADAHAPLGSLASSHDYDWNEAGRQFLLAMPGSRGSPLVHFGCGLFYLLGSGRGQEAVEQLELAVQGDPLHLTYRAVLGMGLSAVGRYEEAEELLQQSLDLGPDFMWTHYYRACIHAARQNFAGALPCAEKAFSLSPWYALCVGLYAGLLVRTGEPTKGGEIVRALGGGEAYGASLGLTIFHTLCGDIDAAADWYERALEERFPIASYFLQSTLGEPLRASPRWPGLAALMNLPAAGFRAT